jgi:adenosylcobyric acid synthase
VTTATGPVAEALPNGLGYVSGAVLGMYVHGIFEEPAVLTALFDEQPARSLDVTFDELADAIEQHLDVSLLLSKAGIS